MNRDPHRLRYLFDRILASDPALDRLHSGLRALLTAGIAAGVFLLITRWFGLEYQLSLAGIVVPMIAVVALQDPGRAAQLATLAWVPLLASAILVLGTLVADQPWLSGACFLLTIFIAFQARRYGPRGNGLGAIAYQSFFYAMLLKTPPDQVGWDPVFVCTGCAIAWAVHAWLVPEHPGRMLESELRACRARVDALWHDLARWLDGGGRKAQARIDGHLAALNAQSLALDGRLAGFAEPPDAADALREQVLRSELAAETVAAVARTLDEADAAGRRDLAARLRGPQAAAPADTASARAPALPPTLRWRLDEALRLLACAPPWRAPLPAMRDERRPDPRQASGRPPATRGGGWFDDTTRGALQACAAALGALLVGRAISPPHWYWAVFAAFVVFTRAATVGQTLSGAWRQVLASVAGLCVGVVFAELVHGNETLELALLFVFVALGFYAFRGMQNVYTVLLTAMLAMLYELMGMNSPGLLAIRLGETVAGAAVAVLSARFVLPVHTADESDDRSAALLRTASLLLGAIGADSPPPSRVAVRELDRELQGVRQSLGPVTKTAYPASKEAHRRHLDRLSRIVYCVRHFYALAAAAGLGRDERVQAAIRILRPRLEGVATMLEAPQRPAQPGPGLPALAEVGPATMPAEPGHTAMDYLAEADALLRALQAELATPDWT